MPVRALILAYDFPPFVSVGGLRPYSWHRYWEEFGVSPVVITRQWNNRHQDELDYVEPSESGAVTTEETPYGTIIRTPYRPNLSGRLLLKYGARRFSFLRRALTACYEIGQFYADVGPRRELHAAARAYLHEHGADVIIATGEPFVLFRYAAMLSREFGIPWIADYRDPWSQDESRRGKRVSKRWEARMERRFTATASAVTTVTPFFRDVIGELSVGRPVHVVPNGFDPEALGGAASAPQNNERLTLGYIGSVYPYQPLDSFLRVCDEFVRELDEPRFELMFVGLGDGGAVEEALARYPGLGRHVTIHPRVPNEDAGTLLSRAHALIQFNTYAIPGTKIYDYLALKRRVLLCYSADAEGRELKERYYNLDDTRADDPAVLETLLAETDGGTVVRDAGHLGAVLSELYQEFLQDGSVACDSHGVERFSRRERAGVMAALIRDLAGG